MKTRAGFTLVEVIMALMLMSVTMLGLQMVAATMLHRNSASQVRLAAAQLAEDRVDLIRLEPVYANIANYAANEDPVAGFPGFRRLTTVNARRDSSATGVTDYKRVSVSVYAPGLTAPIVRNLTVGAP